MNNIDIYNRYNIFLIALIFQNLNAGKAKVICYSRVQMY